MGAELHSHGIDGLDLAISVCATVSTVGAQVLKRRKQVQKVVQT